MNLGLAATAVVLVALTAPVAAQTAGCDNPNALGVSRTIVVDPAEHTRLGTMQYPETLPLNDHEVVLTFDDGPLPKYSSQVLEILASQCVKATYFMVGRMAQEYPDMVRRIAAAGHTIGTHSQNHPLTFQRMPPEKFSREIDDGIASVSAALGDPHELAPFFRIPGLLRQDDVEGYLASRGIMTWSADFPADDWKHRIRAAEVVKRALTRLEAKGRGILLLHDIKPVTVAALPVILAALKERGYKIVHVVPATPDRPKTATLPQQWVIGHYDPWKNGPVSTESVENIDAAQLPAPSPQSFGVSNPLSAETTIAYPPASARSAGRGRLLVPPGPGWQPPDDGKTGAVNVVLPAPSPDSFIAPEPPAAAPSAAPPAAAGKHADLIGDLILAQQDDPSAPGLAAAAPSLGPVTTANMPRYGIP